MQDQQISVGVYGAAGYTGQALIALLAKHPHVALAFATSDQDAGQPVPGTGLTYQAHEAVSLEGVEAAFLCLPHAASAPVAAQALQAGAKVIDLSADLRLDDPAVYAQWYGVEHPAPDLLPAPYGLPEFLPEQTRPAVAGAKAVANPGCYPTATLLGLYPLLASHALADGAPIIVDAKSGVSGAGRTPRPITHFVEVFGNLSPYSVGRVHRHVAEMEQQIAKANGRREELAPGLLIFTPHLLPVDRGLMATIYVQLRPGWSGAAVQSLYQETYAAEPLVEVLPAGQHATLKHAVHRPHCVLSLTPATETTLIVVSVLDNLLKGAASQAVQNFNLMFGWPETTALI